MFPESKLRAGFMVGKTASLTAKCSVDNKVLRGLVDIRWPECFHWEKSFLSLCRNDFIYGYVFLFSILGGWLNW